jgi:WD40 repeat protein
MTVAKRLLGAGGRSWKAAAVLWAAVGLAGAAPAPAPDEKGGRTGAPTDLYGDPLPEGAVARLGTVRFHVGDGVQGVAHTPDGKALASAGGSVLHLWDPETGRELRRLESPPGFPSFGGPFVFSADGKTLAEVGQLGRVRVWDVADGKPLMELDEKYRGEGVVFSPDGRRLATTCGRYDMQRNRVVKDSKVWDAATGKELLDLPECTAWGFTADGKNVAVSGAGSDVLVWRDLETRKERGRIETGRKTPTAAALSPDGTVLAFTNVDGGLTVWDPAAGKETRRLKDPEGDVCCFAFAPDGKAVVTSADDMTFTVWDVATGERRGRVEVKSHHGIALAPGGKTLAAGYLAGVRRWDVASGEERSPRPYCACTDFAFSPDGKVLAAAGGMTRNGEKVVVQQWDAATGRLLCEWRGGPGGVAPFAFSPDGRAIAAGARPRVWDIETGEILARAADAASAAFPPVYSPDGKSLTVPDAERILTVEAATGKVLRSVRLDKDEAYDGEYALSPDARLYVASRGPGGGQNAPGGADLPLFSLFDAATGKPLRSFGNPTGNGSARSPRELLFSPDGKVLADLKNEGEVRLWRTADGKEWRHLHGGGQYYRSLAFSPDGKLLADGGDDLAVHVWEVVSGREVKRFCGAREWLGEKVFSPDGRFLAADAGGDSVLIWDLAGAGRPAARLEDKDLERLWDDLGGADAEKAFRARQTLTAAPAEAAPFLSKRLQALAAPVPEERMRRLIAGLDDDDFKKREEAFKELAALGGAAGPALRAALEAKPSLEARLRLERLTAMLDGPESPFLLRLSRAVAALESSDAPEARRALETLAGGPDGSEVTAEAKTALERLGRRRSSAAP